MKIEKDFYSDGTLYFKVKTEDNIWSCFDSISALRNHFKQKRYRRKFGAQFCKLAGHTWDSYYRCLVCGRSW